MTLGLEDLPVELLYEVQLHALSDALPRTSKHLAQVFASTGSTFRAEYILDRTSSIPNIARKGFFTIALCYPICTIPVFDALLKHPSCPSPSSSSSCELPRRWFRSLAPNMRWTDKTAPIPFLEHVYASSSSGLIPKPWAGSHDGYGLTKAVHARFIPLVRFLLNHGASPSAKKGLAVLVAIRQKDLELVKTLIERSVCARERERARGKKRRKLEDRIKPTPEMLKAAVRCNARDIVDYLMKEKDCIPDLQTVQMLMA